MKSFHAILCLALLACSSDSPAGESEQDADSDAGSDAGPTGDELDYADPALWMCRGAADDACGSSDQTATRVRKDGTFVRVEATPAAEPAFDCFYLHPTQGEEAVSGVGNAAIDPEGPIYALVNQAARFVTVCRVFAPYYRQMRLDSYDVAEDFETTEYFARAYGDVSRAFDHYMAHDNQGRPFVLMGHSQGSHHATRLLQDRFDAEQPERAQLLSALLIGPVGSIVVPEGKLVGGTFASLPLCSQPGQRGCVVAFDARVADDAGSSGPARPIPAGMQWACVNPARIAGGGDVLAESIWPVDGGIPFPEAARGEPWVAYPEAYTARCEPDGSLGIAAVADDPRSPIQPALVQAGLTSRGLGTSLHLADYNFALGDLLRIVTAQAAAR